MNFHLIQCLQGCRLFSGEQPLPVCAHKFLVSVQLAKSVFTQQDHDSTVSCFFFPCRWTKDRPNNDAVCFYNGGNKVILTKPLHDGTSKRKGVAYPFVTSAAHWMTGSSNRCGSLQARLRSDCQQKPTCVAASSSFSNQQPQKLLLFLNCAHGSKEQLHMKGLVEVKRGKKTKTKNGPDLT